MDNKIFKMLGLFLVLSLSLTPLAMANQTNGNYTNGNQTSTQFDNIFEVEQNNTNTALIIFMIILFIALSFIEAFKLISSVGVLSIGFMLLFSGFPVLIGLFIAILGVILMFR